MSEFKKIGLVLATILALGFSGCGSSSDDVAPTQDNDKTTSIKYNGAGSRWDLEFKSDGNATIKELNSNLEINATYKDLTSGFRKITVTSSNNTSKVNIGDITYGFELPDYMFSFVAFDENKLVASVKKGECPVGDIKHNFLVLFARTNKPLNDFQYNKGYFESWGSGGGYWYTQDKKLYPYKFQNGVMSRILSDACEDPSNSNYDASQCVTDEQKYRVENFDLSKICKDGTLYDNSGDSETTAYFTKSGALIWQQKGNNDDRIENDFMIPYEPNLNTIDQIDGNYIGYSIVGEGHLGYTNQAIKANISNGNFDVDIVNPEDGTKINDYATLSINHEVANTKGLWNGTITTTDGTMDIACAIDLDAGKSGKNVIFCNSYKTNAKNEYRSFILVNK